MAKIINSVRIGVIGCGRVAQHYKKIFNSGEIKNFNLVGFCDILIDKSREIAEFFDSNFYEDYELMLAEEKPDLVIILTPSGFHYHHTKTALEFNCNVLCEKPISMLPKEAQELQKLAAKKNLMYGTAFQNRLNPAIKVLEKALKKDRFGKIITATIRLRWCRYQNYYQDGWHGTWAQDGGVINQQAIHHVDAINWLIGPIKSVNATITNQLNKLEAEDTLVAIMKFENGALGTIEATTAARPEDFEASLSVVGEKGMVEIGGIALNKIKTWKFVKSLPEDKKIPDQYSQEVENGYGISHKPLLQNIIDTLKEGKINTLVSPEEAINTSKVVHALYKSDEERSWVKINDNPISSRLGK